MKLDKSKNEGSFIRQMTLTAACILAIVVAARCSATTQPGAATQSVGKGKETQPFNEYRIISDQATRTIDTKRIRNLIADLDSTSLSKRTSAISELKKRIGLDFRYDPKAEQKKREVASKRWKKYADNLDVAIGKEIPKLIEKPTGRNRYKRGLAVMFLGEPAPHPAFLPLLKAVIKNAQEDHRTRYKALTAVTQIPHDGMIEFLIERLDTDLAFRAWDQLSKLTYSGIDNDTNNWRDVKRKYEKWWRKNKAKYVYKRGRVMRE